MKFVLTFSTKSQIEEFVRILDNFKYPLKEDSKEKLHKLDLEFLPHQQFLITFISDDSYSEMNMMLKLKFGDKLFSSSPIDGKNEVK
jgi:hypothetical protein